MAVGISAGTAWRALAGFIALLVLVLLISLGFGLPGRTVFNISVWFGVLSVAAAGLWLLLGAKRPTAGLGALLAAASALLSIYWRPWPASLIWTLGLMAGVGLIAYGTNQDSLKPGAWPLLLPRFMVVWLMFDNGQNDMVWLTGTNGFVTNAQTVVKRGPLWAPDGPYLGFLQGQVIPGGDTWAGLHQGAIFLFGLLVMVGLFGAVAQLGTMWISANIIMEKSLLSHGAFSDKCFFVVGAFNFITAANLSFSLDAALRHHVPGWVAHYLMGAAPEASGAASPVRRLDAGLSGASVT